MSAVRASAIFLLSLLVGLVCAQGPFPDRETFMKNIEECKTKTGVTDDQARTVMRHRVPETKPEQCMLACMHKKAGIMGADNKINPNKLKEMLAFIKEHSPEHYTKVTAILDECKAAEITTSDECEAARSFAQCSYTKEATLKDKGF